MNIDSIIAKVEKRIAKDTVLRQKLLGAKKLIGQVLEPEVLAARAGAPAAQKAKNSAAKSKSKEKTTAKPGSPAIGLHRRDGKTRSRRARSRLQGASALPRRRGSAGRLQRRCCPHGRARQRRKNLKPGRERLSRNDLPENGRRAGRPS